MSNIFTGKVNHYYPTAAVLFIPNFGEVLETQILLAKNTDVKEINTVLIERTVKNSPGTFTINIIDNENKFILPDKPATEITNLYNKAQRKVNTVASSNRAPASKYTATPPSGSVNNYYTKDYGSTRGNHYPYKDYNTWKEDYIIYATLNDDDKAKQYPTMFVRDNAGTIIERWCFLDDGSIAVISTTSIDEASITDGTLQTGEMQVQARTYLPQGGVTTTSVTIHRKYNKELTEGIFRELDEQGDKQGEFLKGKAKISPMDRVVIFLPPRFNLDGSINQKPNNKLIRAFTGVVNIVQQGYSNNQHTLTVSGEDVTKYLRLSVINVDPSLPVSQTKNVEQHRDENVTIWGNIFQGLTTPDIVKLVLLGSKESNLEPRKLAKLSQKIDGVQFYKLSTKGNFSTQNLEYDIESDSLKASPGTVGKEIPRADFTKMLGPLFKKTSVHVMDPYLSLPTTLTGFSAYKYSMKSSFSFYQSDFKTRRDIIYKAAEDSNFNFYADAFGDIWFHPMRFDISWILGAKNPRVYVIKNEDIISYGFIEDDSELFTAVYVDTEPDFAMEDLTELGNFRGSFADEIAILKYGQRIFTASNPIINTSAPVGKSITKIEDRYGSAYSVFVYAKSLLQRILAGKYQGQIVIPGRAEIDPGRPIYVPMRNMLYYVETVSHEMGFNEGYQTTLHLSYGRKPWEYLPELLTFSANDEVYSTDGGILTGQDVLGGGI